MLPPSIADFLLECGFGGSAIHQSLEQRAEHVTVA